MTQSPSFVFQFRARIIGTVHHPDGVIDGDTLAGVEIDRGFADRSVREIRVAHINTPEVRGPTRIAGLAATDFTRAWLAARRQTTNGTAWPLVVTTLDGPAGANVDAFGRVLAEVADAVTGERLDQALLKGGYGIPFEG